MAALNPIKILYTMLWGLFSRKLGVGGIWFVFFRELFLEGAISKWHRALSTPHPCLKVFSSLVMLSCSPEQEALRDCKECMRQREFNGPCGMDGEIGLDGGTS